MITLFMLVAALLFVALLAVAFPFIVRSGPSRAIPFHVRHKASRRTPKPGVLFRRCVNRVLKQPFGRGFSSGAMPA